MDKATRSELDRRLEAGFAAGGYRDAREDLRTRLRDLKSARPEAFERAVAYYEDTVGAAILGGSDPVETWIGYGRVLGELSDEGSLMVIDPSGRASDYSPPVQPDHLVLFVPETGRNALLVLAPAGLSAAQDATIQLLVEGRLALS